MAVGPLRMEVRMVPGPLPKDEDEVRRRNAPTIPTTKLPAGGFTGKAPRVPKAYDLAEAGKAWWRWAWKTPQAAAWSSGDTYALARRAQLEDELVAIGSIPEISIAEVLADAISADSDPDEMRKVAEALEWLLSALQRAAGPANAIRREMRELDDRFGLTAKGLAALRWKIVATEPEKKSTPSPVKATAPSRGGLSRLPAAIDLG